MGTLQTSVTGPVVEFITGTVDSIDTLALDVTSLVTSGFRTLVMDLLVGKSLGLLDYVETIPAKIEERFVEVARAAVYTVGDPIIQHLQLPLLRAVREVAGALNHAVSTLVNGVVDLGVNALLPAVTRPIESVADVLRVEVVDGWTAAVANPVFVSLCASLSPGTGL